MTRVDLCSCPLAYGDNDEHRCVWCGSPLSGRQRRWCSEECSRAYGVNHWWTAARKEAIRRDNRTCQGCGTRFPHRYDPITDRSPLEVDHIVPADGRHGKTSCIHHLDNLRTLCVACHRSRTRTQRLTTVPSGA